MTVGFLSELAKVMPLSDTATRPDDKIYLAQQSSGGWEG